MAKISEEEQVRPSRQFDLSWKLIRASQRALETRGMSGSVPAGGTSAFPVSEPQPSPVNSLLEHLGFPANS
jgi:hypothetical protein